MVLNVLINSSAINNLLGKMVSKSTGSEFTNLVKRYIEQAQKVNTHTGKFLVLSRFLDQVFNVKIEELIPGIEVKLGSKIIGVRGRADLIYRNVVLEIKVDLNKEIGDAKSQLTKYLQALLEKEPESKNIGIATDAVSFFAYTPLISKGHVAGLKEVSSINLSSVSIDEGILWLDSFLFSKTLLKPTAEDLKRRFGSGSPTYAISIDELETMWRSVENEEDIKLKRRLWEKHMEIVYGSSPDVKVFLDQTYLVTLVKLMVYLRLSGTSVVTEENISKALSGEYFRDYGISNLIEEGYFAWLSHPKIVKDTNKLATGLAKELLRYDISQIDEDVFTEIYQDIVERGQRHRVGEYYTPRWLAELLLREALGYGMKVTA
jgi:hypothetical protein